MLKNYTQLMQEADEKLSKEDYKEAIELWLEAYCKHKSLHETIIEKMRAVLIIAVENQNRPLEFFTTETINCLLSSKWQNKVSPKEIVIAR